MPHPILNTQNDPGLLKLLKASTVAYTRAKRGEIIVTFVLVLISVAYPFAFVYLPTGNAANMLFACSFVLTILMMALSGFFNGNTLRGAVFKELFDIALFGLPWKSTIKKPAIYETMVYADSYKGKEIANWYSTELSVSIPHNTAVAVLQFSNTRWDILLRKLYSRWLFILIVAYTASVAVLVTCRHTDWLTIFLIYFSVLPFYTHFIGLVNGQRVTIGKRQAISIHLDELIRSKRDITIGELRDVQDEIFITRQEPAKVPNFFFHVYRRKLEVVNDQYIAEINRIYA
jgi:uncharacterized RDD family membrane protein YckC